MLRNRVAIASKLGEINGDVTEFKLGFTDNLRNSPVELFSGQGQELARLDGIIAPILTPFENGGQISWDLWRAHAHWVLGQGAHFLSPFGTTGEALSVSMTARMAALSDLVEAGIPAARLMPGTGLTSLDDTVSLTRHAVELGVAAVMVLPSFFYADANDDGHFRYFSALVDAVADARLKICLYNIPQNTGVPVSAELAARLYSAYPDTFVAFKDSSGDWDNTLSVIRAAPGLAVFPGTETLMVRALANGGAGCISATVNLNARAIRAVYEAASGGNETVDDTGIVRFRGAVQQAGLIAAMKSVLAVRYDDNRWLNLRPPLQDGTIEMGQALLSELGPLATHIVKPG